MLGYEDQHIYSPRVEESINHYFSFNEKRHLDLNKVKLVLDEYEQEAKVYFSTARKSPFKNRSDPFLKDPVVRAKLLEIQSQSPEFEQMLREKHEAEAIRKK